MLENSVIFWFRSLSQTNHFVSLLAEERQDKNRCCSLLLLSFLAPGPVFSMLKGMAFVGSQHRKDPRGTILEAHPILSETLFDLWIIFVHVMQF